MVPVKDTIKKSRIKSSNKVFNRYSGGGYLLILFFYPLLSKASFCSFSWGVHYWHAAYISLADLLINGQLKGDGKYFYICLYQRKVLYLCTQ